MISKLKRLYIKTQCNSAIRILRELEDWARLEEENDALADRFRECYECITERVLNGRKGIGLSRRQMQDVIDWLGY